MKRVRVQRTWGPELVQGQIIAEWSLHAKNKRKKQNKTEQQVCEERTLRYLPPVLHCTTRLH
jgi:hypothetical protein